MRTILAYMAEMHCLMGNALKHVFDQQACEQTTAVVSLFCGVMQLMAPL